MKNKLSRREFIRLTTAGLAALPFGLKFHAAQAGSPDIRDMVIINALGGLSNQNLWVETRSGKRKDGTENQPGECAA